MTSCMQGEGKAAAAAERRSCEKGSYTIEVSMIFSCIVLTVVLLLFTFLYMQQKASLTNAAAFTAQQGAELWLDSRRSMENGKVNSLKTADSIGYRVFDNLFMSSKVFEGYLEEEESADEKSKLVLKMDTGSNLPDKKVALIGEAMCGKIGSPVLKPQSTRIKIIYSNNALRGRLAVEITQEIKVPFGGIKKLLDGKETLTLRGYSEAAVSEPAEYIRNIDLAIELFKRLEGKLDFSEFMDKVGSDGRK